MNIKISYIKICLIFIFFAFVSDTIYGKIRLIVCHYNRPDFLRLQYQTFKKFLVEKDEFELIVLNDAIHPQMRDALEITCRELGLKSIIFPQYLHNQGVLIDYLKKLPFRHDIPYGQNGSVRYCQLIRYGLENFGYNHDDIIGIVEGDVFLVKKYSIRQSLNYTDILGVMRPDRGTLGIEYLWIGLCFADMQRLPNKYNFCFDLTYVDTTFLDAGGATYEYLKNNSEVKVEKHYPLFIKSLPRYNAKKLKDLGFANDEIELLGKLKNHVDY